MRITEHTVVTTQFIDQYTSEILMERQSISDRTFIDDRQLEADMNESHKPTNCKSIMCPFKHQ